MTVKLINNLSLPIPYSDEITRSIWSSSLKTHEQHLFFQRMVLGKPLKHYRAAPTRPLMGRPYRQPDQGEVVRMPRVSSRKSWFE